MSHAQDNPPTPHYLELPKQDLGPLLSQLGPLAGKLGELAKGQKEHQEEGASGLLVVRLLREGRTLPLIRQKKTLSEQKRY